MKYKNVFFSLFCHPFSVSNRFSFDMNKTAAAAAKKEKFPLKKKEKKKKILRRKRKS